MNLSVRPLDPSLAETFVGFFDSLSFEHAKDWKGCYCRYYQTPVATEVWMRRPASLNREDALLAIRNGSMTGFLAFEGDRCVGWVNAGEAQNYPRLAKDLEPFCGTGKTGLSICFVVDPEWRNRGIARSLLGAAVADFRKRGFSRLLGLPLDVPMPGDRRYRGTLNMYREAGFAERARIGNTVVMELSL